MIMIVIVPEHLSYLTGLEKFKADFKIPIMKGLA